MPGRPCVRRREIAGNVDCPARQWLACERRVGLEIGVWKLKMAREDILTVKMKSERKFVQGEKFYTLNFDWVKRVKFSKKKPKAKKQPCAKAKVEQGKIPTCSLSTCNWRFRVHRDHLYAHGWTFLPHLIPPDQRFSGKHIFIERYLAYDLCQC